MSFGRVLEQWLELETGDWILQGFCPTLVASDDVRLTFGWSAGVENENMS